MSEKMQTEVLINSVDVGSKLLSWKTEETNGEAIQSCEIHLTKNADSLVTLSVGQTISIKRGVTSSTDYFVFEGEIVEIKEEGHRYKIKGMDKLYEAIRREVTTVFDANVGSEAGQISEIFKTLINDYTDLTANDTSVVATGTSAKEILTKYICRHEDVYDKLQELANLVDYQFYYDPDDSLVHFEPEGYTSGSVDLEVGNNVSNRPTWKSDNSELCNDVSVQGATQHVETTVDTAELDSTTGWTSGDGGTSAEFSFRPVSVKVWADSSNPPTTLRKGGKEGATSAYDYYVDFENKKLVWSDSNGYNWTSGHYVDVQYTYSIPVPVSAYNQSSIDTYGRFTRTISPKQIDNVDDAEVSAKRFLDKYSTPFQSTTLHVKNVYDLEAGESVRVIDSKNSIDGNFVINKIVKRFPHNFDKVKIGNKALKTSGFEADIIKKIQEFEQMFTGDSDFVVQLVQSEIAETISRKSLNVKHEFINDTFYLDHDNNSILDQSKVLDNMETDVTSDWSGSGVTISWDSGAGGEESKQSYLTGDDAVGTIYGSSQWRAQTFTASSAYTISKVAIKAYKTGNPGTITASIRATSSNLPTGSDLSATGTYNGNLLTTSTSGEWIELDIGDYALTNGVQYAIVVRASSGDASNTVKWLVDTSGTFSGGTYVTGTSSGSWVKNDSFDFLFNVYGLSDTGGITPIQGSYQIKAVFASAITGTITTTQDFEDVSDYTGENSGTPSQGTCGVWLYVDSASDITACSLRLGSGASDYKEYNAQVYSSSINHYDEDFTLQAGWNFLIFDLDDPDGTSGTPDWTNCDYARISLTSSQATTCYLDLFSISKSNKCPNILDERYTTKSDTTTTY